MAGSFSLDGRQKLGQWETQMVPCASGQVNDKAVSIIKDTGSTVWMWEHHWWNQNKSPGLMIATAMIKVSLQGSTTIVKRVSVENFVPSISGPVMAVFRELWGLSVIFLLSNREKAHPFAEPRRLTYYEWKSVQGPGLWATAGTPKKTKPSKHLWCKFARTGKRNPLRDRD